MGVRAAVLGASGFTGGEVLRYLSGHPAIELALVSAGTRAGAALEEVQPHLLALSGMQLGTLADGLTADVDVCFSCLPGGELPAHLDQITAPLVVDLADDYRADSSWIYGLTEFARDSIREATRIANPGCYPTASLLSLVPFAKASVVEGPVVIDALSGYSGAGRKAADQYLFAGATGSVTSYGAIPHRHVAEMEGHLQGFSNTAFDISFTPHLVPTARGVLTTVRSRLKTSLTDEQALGILTEAYANEAFVHVVEDWPATKAVAGTNHALVSAHVDAAKGWLISSCAIDNLGKGAAGQAVQNANLALGIDESTGLEGVGVWP
ncbi:MAG TPA: N-acetyl-gamma-glutamyl-phosphate reductase [Actinomycetota bacterium]|nr:N-acetyl-gamma-glutamyl-phosphate reductase [Actinomycetota bacterium]